MWYASYHTDERLTLERLQEELQAFRTNPPRYLWDDKGVAFWYDPKERFPYGYIGTVPESWKDEMVSAGWLDEYTGDPANRTLNPRIQRVLDLEKRKRARALTDKLPEDLAKMVVDEAIALEHGDIKKEREREIDEMFLRRDRWYRGYPGRKPTDAMHGPMDPQTAMERDMERELLRQYPTKVRRQPRVPAGRLMYAVDPFYVYGDTKDLRCDYYTGAYGGTRGEAGAALHPGFSPSGGGIYTHTRWL